MLFVCASSTNLHFVIFRTFRIFLFFSSTKKYSRGPKISVLIKNVLDDPVTNPHAQCHCRPNNVEGEQHWGLIITKTGSTFLKGLILLYSLYIHIIHTYYTYILYTYRRLRYTYKYCMVSTINQRWNLLVFQKTRHGIKTLGYIIYYTEDNYGHNINGTF